MALLVLERALVQGMSCEVIETCTMLTSGSIANTSRGWGDMVREYGNSIKDMTGAAGSRATTKGNPLGLSTGTAGGAASMASRPGFTGGAAKKGSASNPLGL